LFSHHSYASYVKERKRAEGTERKESQGKKQWPQQSGKHKTPEQEAPNGKTGIPPPNPHRSPPQPIAPSVVFVAAAAVFMLPGIRVSAANAHVCLCQPPRPRRQQ